MFIGAWRAGVIYLFIFMLLLFFFLRFHSREGKCEAREGARLACEGRGRMWLVSHLAVCLGAEWSEDRRLLSFCACLPPWAFLSLYALFVPRSSKKKKRKNSACTFCRLCSYWRKFFYASTFSKKHALIPVGSPLFVTACLKFRL